MEPVDNKIVKGHSSSVIKLVDQIEIKEIPKKFVSSDHQCDEMKTEHTILIKTEVTESLPSDTPCCNTVNYRNVYTMQSLSTNSVSSPGSQEIKHNEQDSSDEDLDLSDISDFVLTDDDSLDSNDNIIQTYSNEFNVKKEITSDDINSADIVGNGISIIGGKCKRKLPQFKRNMIKPAEHNFTDLTQLELGNNVCSVCNKIFKLRNKLLAHFSIHPPENLKLYDLSKKPSSALIDVDIVSPTPEEIKKKPFVCALCPKRFRKWAGLEAHCCVHTGEKPYVCNICSKAYRDKSYIIGHALLHKGKVPFECDICKKSFTRKQSLDCHLLTHTGERPHVCDICHQTFRKKNLMIIHYRLHVNDFPFTCKQCGRRFRSKPCLINHARTHSNDKPFACDICPKSFTQKRWLRKHKEFHDGKRKFECQLCFHAMKRKAAFELHMTLHTGERPFVCEICRKGFTRECFLTLHIRTHSEEEIATISNIKSERNSINLTAHKKSVYYPREANFLRDTTSQQIVSNDKYSVL